MMYMWYWFGQDLGTFLISGYNISTALSLLFTCIGLIALAILYEAMKILQVKLQQDEVPVVSRPVSRSSENSSLLSTTSPNSLNTSSTKNWSALFRWILQVFHWSIYTTLGYILMMAVMTYNAYISIVLVIGGGLGYWIFGPVLIQLNMARFRERQRKLRCSKECADDTFNRDRHESAVSIVAEELVTEATAEIHLPRGVC